MSVSILELHDTSLQPLSPLLASHDPGVGESQNQRGAEKSKNLAKSQVFGKSSTFGQHRMVYMCTQHVRLQKLLMSQVPSGTTPSMPFY